MFDDSTNPLFEGQLLSRLVAIEAGHLIEFISYLQWIPIKLFSHARLVDKLALHLFQQVIPTRQSRTDAYPRS